MEAAATPLPREDTTPPVTKMYFGAVRKVACESPECLRTNNYAAETSVCQIANRDARNLVFERAKGDVPREFSLPSFSP